MRPHRAVSAIDHRPVRLVKPAAPQRLRIAVDDEGRYRIDAVPPGSYTLHVSFNGRNGPGSLRDHRFTVPPLAEGRSDAPLNLGDLVLQK